MRAVKLQTQIRVDIDLPITETVVEVDLLVLDQVVDKRHQCCVAGGNPVEEHLH